MSAVPPPPMTASGRMPPTGRYFSPASKQQVKEGVSTPRMSSLGTETTTTSTNVPLDNSTTNVTATVNNNTNEEDVDDMDDYGTPTTHTSVNSPPSSSAPKQQHQQHSLVAQDNDGYGAPPSPAVTSAHHPPGRLGPSPLGMSARGSSGGGGNNNNSGQGSSPSPLDGTVPVQRRAAPTFKAPSMHKQPGPSPLQSSSGAVPTTTTTAAAAADNNNNNNNGKGSKVEDYTAAAVVRTRKERVKPKALIAPPGHLSERPERALYSLNAVDRSTWRARVVAENPHIGELRERVYPLARGIAFCKLFHPGQRQAKEELKQTQVVQLILQHLQLKGFNATRRVLEKEAHVATPRHKLHTSRLAAFVHAAIRDTDAVYDYVIGEKVDFGKQAEERVWQMGLQEEEEESEDCDIWQEPADRVRFEPEGELKGNVKCGSFNKLVELLTDEYVISHNDYLQTFLLTYQSFATPEKLLQKIVQRFNVPATAFQGQQAQQAQAQTLIIRGRVCNFLRKWIEEYPTDFDEKLNVQVKQFIDIVAATPATTRLIAPVSNSFQKMLAESRAARRSARTAAAEPPEPIVPQNFFSRRWDQWHPLELDEEEIARQLSLLDWESFRKIKPTELLNQAWSKPKLKHRAPNVLAFIAQFNRTSAWAATEILSAPNIRERIRVVTKLIKISEKLTAMNNFNSVMSISAALNCSSVSRLKHTFAELSPYALKGKKDLEELVSSDGNFKVLRQRIAAIDPNTTPCIPYLGFILSDLTFTDENPDKINGMINFGKRVLVYKIIHGLLSRQTTPYNFQPVQQIVRILKKAPLKKDDELYELSLKHEPRGAPRSQIK